MAAVDCSSGTYDVRYDTVRPPFVTDQWTQGSDGKWQFPEMSAILQTDPSPWTAGLKLFVIRANGDAQHFARSEPYTDLLLEGYTCDGAPFDHVVMFTEPMYRPLAQVIPHEFGHLLGLAFYDDDGGSHDTGACPDGTEKLMRPGGFTGPPPEDPVIPEFGQWLRHEDWGRANDHAGTL